MNDSPANDERCKCDLRTKLVGDGCEHCNPDLAAELSEWDEDEELGCADLEDRLDAAFERADKRNAR